MYGFEELSIHVEKSRVNVAWRAPELVLECRTLGGMSDT